MAATSTRTFRPSAGQRRLGGKLVGTLLSLAFVLVFNFFLFRVLPGDPAKNLTRNRLVPAEQVQVLRESFGLGKPLPQQFAQYVRDTLSGDLGISYKFRRPVSEVIGERIWPTVLLLGISTMLSTVIGLWIGIRGAWRRESVFDRVSLGASLALYAMPEFWLGILLLIAFGVGVGGFPGLFPTGGLSSPNTPLASVGGVLDEDYLVTARAKGLRDALVLRRHAVPNALLPTTTLIFLNLGFVVSGAITIETVYSWRGLGLLSYEALRTPTVRSCRACSCCSTPA